MGKVPLYRDEADQDALSMHTTRDNYEYDTAPALPTYSEAESAAAVSSLPQTRPQASTEPTVPADPYPALRRRGLHMSGGKSRNVHEVSIRMEPELTSDASRLQGYIEDCICNIPPSPLVRIVGTHHETRYNSSTKKSEKVVEVDFDITFNLQHHLVRQQGSWRAFVPDNSEKQYRGSFRKTRAKGYTQAIEVGEEGTPTLQDWCEDYVNTKAYLKIFRIERQLTHFDHEAIRAQVLELVRSTHYHGNVDISFPIEERFVDIYNPNWVNWCRISWVRYIFYFLFLWILVWPVLFCITRWWSVYTIQWAWSRVEADAEGRRKVYSTVSEKEWVKQRSNLIRLLVLEKFQGEATSLSTDVPDESVAQKMRGSIPSTGNANVDAAVNFVQAGRGLLRAVSGQGSADSRGWGGNTT